MIKVFNLSKKGRAALKGTDPLTDKQLLIMEVVARTGNITQEHCCDLATQIILKMGSAEAGLEAVRDGTITITPAS